MMRIGTITSCFVILSQAYGQSMEWVVPVDLNFPANGAFRNTSMAVSPEGQVGVTGVVGDPFWYGSELFGDVGFNVFDPDGEVITSATYSGKGYIKELVSHNGAFYAVGLFLDSLSFPGHPQLVVTGEANNVGGFVCKIEASGFVTWLHDLHDFDIGGLASALTIDENGELYLAAWDFTNSVIVRVNSDGALLESWMLNGVGLVSDIAVNIEGKVAIAGSCLSPEVDFNGTTVTAPDDYTVFTARFAANGAYQDHLIIRDVTCPSPSVVLDDAGNSYFCADAFMEVEAGPFTVQDPPWVYGEFILRIEPTGEVSWLVQPIHGASLGDASRAPGTDLVLHPDGGVLLGGFTRGNMDWGNGVFTNATPPETSLYVWHIDEFGNTVGVVTGDQPNYTQSVHSAGWAGSNAFYVLGVGYDTLHLGGAQLPAQGHHLFLSRWSEVGTGVGDHSEGTSLEIYPNPAADQLMVDLSGFSGVVDLEVLDMQGRVVLVARRSASGIERIDLSGLRSATYIVQALQNGSVLRQLCVKQ